MPGAALSDGASTGQLSRFAIEKGIRQLKDDCVLHIGVRVANAKEALRVAKV